MSRFSDVAIADLVNLAEKGMWPGALLALSAKHGHTVSSMASKLQQLRARCRAKDVRTKESEEFLKSVRSGTR